AATIGKSLARTVGFAFAKGCLGRVRKKQPSAANAATSAVRNVGSMRAKPPIYIPAPPQPSSKQVSGAGPMTTRDQGVGEGKGGKRDNPRSGPFARGTPDKGPLLTRLDRALCGLDPLLPTQQLQQDEHPGRRQSSGRAYWHRRYQWV